MKPVVFAGPSVFGLPDDLMLDFDLRPPARAGDILRAVVDGTEIIGLIDGVFDWSPAVWHKEILAALYRGVKVFGASSMGALRAAECHQYGMIGVGKIFHDYRDGIRTADADVAIVHAPQELGFRPITQALVDVQATLDALLQKGILEPVLVGTLLDTARSLGFRGRSWPEIVARSAERPDYAHELLQVILEHEISQKQIDAVALLNMLSSGVLPRLNRSRLIKETFNQTDLFASLHHRISRDSMYESG